MSDIDVLLPAGGRIDDAFAAEAGTSIKALLKVGETTILERTISALRATGRVSRIVVAGPPEVHEVARRAGADELVHEGASGPDNIYRGLEALTHSGVAPTQLLVVTTDLPFLTGDILNRYLDICPSSAEFTVPLIAKSAYQQRFPGSDATYVKLQDGEWTTGCAYLMSPEALLKARPHIESVFKNRKSKLGMARLLGLGFVFKWLTGSLTVADVEKKVVSLLEVKGTAVPGAPPELAFDIDYLEDYRFAIGQT